MLKTLELPKLSNKLGLKGYRAGYKLKTVPETTTDKIFEKNSSFHVK